jgi:lysophospholipase L1-like esterase
MLTNIVLLRAAAVCCCAVAPCLAQRADAPNPAYAAVADTPGLARVLILGDSISIGYTVPVRTLLAGKANVHRPADNSGPTTHGVQFVETWLGKEKWDVIHFNFGLHDLKLMWDGKPQVSLADYQRNLRRLVGRLKQSGAVLVWASTTAVPDGPLSPPRSDAAVVRYNRAALKVMKENGVAVNDLYAFIRPRLADLGQPHNVHFTEAGYQALAGKVAAAVEKALAAKAAK